MTESMPRFPWQRSWTRTLGRIMRWLIGGYILAIIVLYTFENRFVYVPSSAVRAWTDPAKLHVEDVVLTMENGTSLHGWWCPCEGGSGAVLYCHGNGGNLSRRKHEYESLQREHNVSVLAFDYPGYGKSDGKPSEAGCCDAATLAYDWLTSSGGVLPEQVILFGESLGGGVAAELATRRPCRALILFSTFTSVPDVAKSIIPILPAKWIMSNRYESLRKVPSIHCPVFIAHGDADRLIPIRHGQALFAAANEPKAFHVDPGRGHTSTLTPAFHEALREFLAQH